MKRTTIKDLALRLGVNVSTVSRALKGHPDIGLDMQQRVKRLAEEMRYTPNSLAAGLRKQHSRIVGLIIPEINMFFYPSVIKGMEAILHREGLNMMVLQSNELLEREIECLRICYENGVEGLLLSVSKNTLDLQHLAEIDAMGLPVVMFDKIVEPNPYDCVTIDDALASRRAVQFLMDTGCREIVGIFGNPNLFITQRRVEGFRQALQQAGRPLRSDGVQFANNPAEAAAICSGLPADIDGFFVMSDELMAGVLPAVRQTGRHIPEDCAVLCISDGFLPHYVYPPVTYIHHSGYEVGRAAAERLVELMKGQGAGTPERRVISTKLVELQSTAKRTLNT